MRVLRPELCAINTATLGFQAPIEETIEAVARQGFGGIAPWRREVEGKATAAIARRISDAGLAVTGYCRSTFIPASTKSDFAANIDSNRRELRGDATPGAQRLGIEVGRFPTGQKALGAAADRQAGATAPRPADADRLGRRP